MTADNQPEIEKAADTQGELRPSASEEPTLEDKIDDEKDNEQARVRAAN
jgi:hypothetical protein